uniref:Uncharacterized protein n=1 Tax=Bradyrhizobium amphicarpaeae TaxID=1404768 RepID=A0A2U8PMG6_9BRAD|nr:hypothetical protein CIT40_02040 [Bradyrhizobium amphicarpaeae]
MTATRTPRWWRELAIAGRKSGALPLPLAGEGWGEGVSTIENPQEDRTLTRRFAPTSPAGGRGAPSLRLDL